MIPGVSGSALENWKKCPLVELSAYENYSTIINTRVKGLKGNKFHRISKRISKMGIENSVRK